MIRYVDSRDYFVMACEFIYMIFVAYYIVEEVELFVIVMILTKTRMRSMLMYIIFVAYYIVEEVELLIIALMSKTKMRSLFIYIIFVAYYISGEVKARHL